MQTEALSHPEGAMRRWRQALGYAVAVLSITLGSGQAQEKPPATSETAAQNAYAEAKELHRRGEYQAELDALARACSAGAFEACHDLGVALYDGKVIPQDLGRAAGLYRQACDHEVGVSCSNLGLMYEKGEGVSEDPKEAVRLYLKACNLRLPKACNNAAFLYLNGSIGVPADPTAAVELFWRACRSNYSMSCANLANLYLAGKGVKVDLGRSLRLRVRACRGLYE